MVLPQNCIESLPGSSIQAVDERRIVWEDRCNERRKEDRQEYLGLRAY